MSEIVVDQCDEGLHLDPNKRCIVKLNKLDLIGQNQ